MACGGHDDVASAGLACEHHGVPLGECHAAEPYSLYRTVGQNYKFFVNGRSSVTAEFRRALDPLNDLARAHLAGLIR